MQQFLITSLVLTIGLNLVLWLTPGLQQRLGRWFSRQAEAGPDREPNERRSSGRGSSVRVFFPWKAMLIGSVVLTVVINLLAAMG